MLFQYKRSSSIIPYVFIFPLSPSLSSLASTLDAGNHRPSSPETVWPRVACCCDHYKSDWYKISHNQLTGLQWMVLVWMDFIFADISDDQWT